MADRSTLLRRLDVGDIFHAEASNGASMICLVLSVTKTAIHARRIGPQEDVEFDRQTGFSDRASAVINSVMPLPAETYNVLLGLDRRYRLGDDPKLTEAEKKALVLVGDYYRAHPLP